MDRDTSRRAVLAALLGGGVAGGFAAPVRGYLDRFAPFAGDVWGAADRDLPGSVESQYGSATLRYDDEGVAHVEGETEAAAAFAVGYAQGADRLFQMDLQRRVMRGELSAVFGERALASDRFHVGMDFAGAAEATWREVERTDSDAAPLVEAFCDGVNRHLDDLPFEFELLDYEPDPWTPEDTMLAEKQISWGLTGSFRTLRKATVEAELGADVADTLFPHRLDHDAQILGHDAGGGSTSSVRGPAGTGDAPHPDVLDWLTEFESPPSVGSNSWLVSGEHTDSGSPILANDPHLSLMAPPVWYEQSVHAPDIDARGVTFPGVPFVVIGATESVAWGFTNAGADVIDFYTYETRNGGAEYRDGEDWREFETERRTITVADGEDREVTVRKSVHGAVLSAESDGDSLSESLGVAWTGLSATRTTEAVLEMNRASDAGAFEAALRKFDEPTQNCIYADADGRTGYRTTGKVPIRRTDGEPVPGTRVFDGSAGEGEWAGYTPYGASTWEGFIPFSEMPTAENPDYVGTANQRIVDDADYPHYFAEAYAAPFRAIELWDRLDERVAGDDPATPAFMRDVQDDAHDVRADLFVETMGDAESAASDVLDGDAVADVRHALDLLDGWDHEMRRDSRPALVFARFFEHYRDRVFRHRVEAGLGDRRDPSEYFGNDWVLIHLDPESAWFPDGRDAAVVRALRDALAECDDEDWEVYGDYNRTAIDHPFDRSWLNYPRYPTDGSSATLNNFRKESAVGSSWRQVVPLDDRVGDCILPGGNDGSLFSEHYSDQLRRWADTEYKPFEIAPQGDVAVEFGGGE